MAYGSTATSAAGGTSCRARAAERGGSPATRAAGAGTAAGGGGGTAGEVGGGAVRVGVACADTLRDAGREFGRDTGRDVGATVLPKATACDMGTCSPRFCSEGEDGRGIVRFGHSKRVDSLPNNLATTTVTHVSSTQCVGPSCPHHWRGCNSSNTISAGGDPREARRATEPPAVPTSHHLTIPCV